EMGISSAAPAYEAQAVVARTYGYAKVRAAPDAPFHVYDDTHSQVYRGVTLPKDTGISLQQLETWTAETRGVVLTWRGEPFPAYKPHTKVVPGSDFRSAAGLRSMRIDSVDAKEDGTLVFRGGGWGHGVGMCQVGAQEMARRGFAADQLLRYYYPGAEFTRLY